MSLKIHHLHWDKTIKLEEMLNISKGSTLYILQKLPQEVRKHSIQSERAHSTGKLGVQSDHWQPWVNFKPIRYTKFKTYTGQMREGMIVLAAVC